jgi:hypothetical protein
LPIATNLASAIFALGLSVRADQPSGSAPPFTFTSGSELCCACRVLAATSAAAAMASV